jgi:hypothetical protein
MEFDLIKVLLPLLDIGVDAMLLSPQKKVPSECFPRS